jgi:4-aminobutyrate aminotransferase-like enzyme
MSKRNDALLKKLAEETAASLTLFRKEALTELAAELSRMTKAALKAKMYTQYDDVFTFRGRGFILLAAFRARRKKRRPAGIEKGRREMKFKSLFVLFAAAFAL